MAESEINVHYVAELARIELTKEEAELFQVQLGEVLHYMEKLQEVDLTDVEKKLAALSCENNLREDIPGTPMGVEKVLANAPDKVEDLLLVPRMIE